MIPDASDYAARLARAPVRDVTPTEFVQAATAARWHPRTIGLMLSKPYLSRPVLVGREGLRIKE